MDFSEPQKELWIRWYMRYENGASWKDNYVFFNKLFYMRTPGTAETATQMIPSLSDDFVLSAQSTGNDQNVPTFTNAGWMDIYPTGVADGRWVCYEIYIKMDTQGVKICPDPENPNSCYHSEPFNGIGRLWVNGQMMGEYTNLNLSEMHSDARQGWSWFDFTNNQADGQVNQALAYVDYDDIVIYNSTPPNIDLEGNTFIGPIGWVNGEDITPPDSPTGLSVF
ncbi:MAG: hypothetical protein V3574_05270 [Candidatus Moraniibacteriota bacterium]